jgi:hypothetical protein
MSNPLRQFATSARFSRHFHAVAWAASLSLLLVSSAKADTILAFGQLNPADVITATESGGVTTLSTANNVDGGNVSVPVLASTYLGVDQSPFGGLLMFETFIGVHSTGTAMTAGGILAFQNFVGTVEFTALPFGSPMNATYLSATFSGPAGTFLGGLGGSSASLGASTPAETVTFSVPLDPAIPGSGMTYENAALALGFSGITPSVGLAGSSIAGFQAQGSGTFSANVVPEPTALCLSSIAAIIGTVGFLRRKAAKDAGC